MLLYMDALIFAYMYVKIKYRKSGNFHCKNIFVVNGGYKISMHY